MAIKIDKCPRCGTPYMSALEPGQSPSERVCYTCAGHAAEHASTAKKQAPAATDADAEDEFGLQPADSKQSVLKTHGASDARAQLKNQIHSRGPARGKAVTPGLPSDAPKYTPPPKPPAFTLASALRTTVTLVILAALSFGLVRVYQNVFNAPIVPEKPEQLSTAADMTKPLTPPIDYERLQAPRPQPEPAPVPPPPDAKPEDMAALDAANESLLSAYQQEQLAKWRKAHPKKEVASESAPGPAAAAKSGVPEKPSEAGIAMPQLYVPDADRLIGATALSSYPGWYCKDFDPSRSLKQTTLDDRSSVVNLIPLGNSAAKLFTFIEVPALAEAFEVVMDVTSRDKLHPWTIHATADSVEALPATTIRATDEHPWTIVHIPLRRYAGKRIQMTFEVLPSREEGGEASGFFVYPHLERKSK